MHFRTWLGNKPQRNTTPASISSPYNSWNWTRERSRPLTQRDVVSQLSITRRIDRSDKSEQLAMLKKTRLSNETFSTPRSVIRQPETLSIRRVLHILDTSRRWLSLNSDLQTLSSRRFAKVVETWNSEVTSLAMFRTRNFLQWLLLDASSTYSHDMDVFAKSNTIISSVRAQTILLTRFLSWRSFIVSHKRMDSNSWLEAFLTYNRWIRSNSVPHFADSANGSSQKPKRYEAKNV